MSREVHVVLDHAKVSNYLWLKFFGHRPSISRLGEVCGVKLERLEQNCVFFNGPESFR